MQKRRSAIIVSLCVATILFATAGWSQVVRSQTAKEYVFPGNQLSQGPVAFGRASGEIDLICWDNVEGAQLALSADTITGLNDDDPVNTWEDQTANGNDVIDSSVGEPPTYKTAILNDLPVVRFNGVDDLLVHATFWDVFPDEFTLYMAVVVRRVGHSEQQSFISKDNIGGQDRVYITIETDNQFRLFTEGSNSGGETAFGPAVLTDDTAYVFTVRFDPGAAEQIWANGTAGTAGDTAVAIRDGTEENFWIGARDVLGRNREIEMDLAELIIFPTAHDDTDRENIEGCLEAKWIPS